jgi:hypothetical protein
MLIRSGLLVLGRTGTQVQWATGKRSPAAADPVVVATDGTTVVDDALLP